MTDALRIAGLALMALAAIMGIGLGILTVFWVKQGLKDLEDVFKL